MFVNIENDGWGSYVYHIETKTFMSLLLFINKDRQQKKDILHEAIFSEQSILEVEICESHVHRER